MCRRFDSAPNHKIARPCSVTAGLFLFLKLQKSPWPRYENYLCPVVTHLKCLQCGEWGDDAQKCLGCGSPRSIHSTFANQGNPERLKAFEMPVMQWNKDPQISNWKRGLINAGKIAHWAVLAVGGALAWMAYWVAV